MSVISPVHKWYYSLLVPYKWRILLILVLLSINSICPALIVFLTERIVDDALLQNNPHAIAWLPIGIIALYALNGLLHISRSMLSRELAWKMVTQVRGELFDHMLQLSIQWRKTKKLFN